MIALLSGESVLSCDETFVNIRRRGGRSWRSIESQWGALVCFLESTGSASCRGKDGEVSQEVSGEASLLVDLCSSARRSSGKFHGKKDVGLAGTFPPLAAQAAK